MSEQTPKRQYEGPARLLQGGDTYYDERMLRERGPYGKSYAEHLTERYGSEGVGWGFETEQHAQDNELKNTLHEPEFRLATEAFRNWLAGEGYTIDGKDVTGKVQRFVRNPDRGNVVVYPDGDVYKAKKEKDQ